MATGDRGASARAIASLADAAAAYEMFQRKADGAVKIMLKPWS